MLLSLAFGICPPQSSLQLALAFLAVDLHFEQLPKEPPRQSTPSSQLVQGDHRPPKSPMRHPRRHRRDRPAHHLLAQAAAESLRHWVPTTPSNPRSRGRLVLPCGITPTGRECLPRLFSRRGSASPISCWVVHGHPPFRGFSPLVAAGSSQIRPSPLPFPTLRCRGFEDLSSPASLAPCDALLAANGCVHHRRRFHAR